ncbi:DUF5994 family protein [Nocardia blacklockiae]|uniref:DUF5994 family protein n=1 Tax=Nocardia blacklockiae TaxID=480036 RepID=UPI001895E66E|nr:DUF5994 family protein [Nocardia blacklockiae]MBF6172343.1 hypothetical protein [Nocardia blacklockiae]
MALLHIHRHTARHRIPPERLPRLRLKPESDGYIDGLWWPRSDRLATELPGLLTFLAIRLGPVRRVVYDQVSWAPAPRQLTVGHGEVQLKAHPFSAGNTMYLFGTDNTMLVLQVIASAADHDNTRPTLTTASEPSPLSGPEARS